VVVHKSVSEEQLRLLFRQYPGCEYCDLKRDKLTGRSKVGGGWVCLEGLFWGGTNWPCFMRANSSTNCHSHFCGYGVSKNDLSLSIAAARI
jgi:hypothetical protein